ncbi:immunity 17 family protein [Parabacteroides sp. PF5-9]|uniref:immunity 17 family protein n=1 Tax=Parabacteroides sp. PF5-9 TaxID=1742404 RepID=UPI002476F8CF|nr:immunity 17 family protein [Parabacteroides sp. PF5-9]MDH6356193.1 putative membrane protein [Parabacteroides sp. PF5-9]
MTDYLLGVIFVLAGLFSLIAAVCNFEWFFTHKKTQSLVKLMGRGGTRIFYGILGLALIVCGILAMFYWDTPQ